ncbi:hypothetical protein PR048_013690 [Dryococelus australis]|uniref:Uncharacterized protein n=1 Tax=Dryococelus australis TaxID=614101 RepID=A0ABQ9HSV9_9NEOP|nr:hypothetical protein PR048_013690 [Dryococelus australis]
MTTLKKKNLSPECNVKTMYQLFLEKHQQCANVKFEFYFRYFKSNFNLSFDQSRSDPCQTCEHIEKKTSPTNLHRFLRFDYQQNITLYKVPSGDAFYKRQLWDETVGEETANEPICFPHHNVSNVLSPGIKVLYLFSDNCVSQNKKHALTQYLFYRVHSGCLKIIVHRLPEPWHSFMPCDRVFGLIEMNLRKLGRIILPTEYTNIIKRASKMFTLVEVDCTMILNFVDGYFCTILMKKFVIKNLPNFLLQRTDCYFTIMTLFSEALCSVERVLDAIPLKAPKHKDVMDHTYKYVGYNEMCFYSQLKSDGTTSDYHEETEGEELD